QCLAPAEIDAFVCGASDPPQRDRVLSHIGTCMRCATMINAAKASSWATHDIGPSTGSSASSLLPDAPTVLAQPHATMTFRNDAPLRPSESHNLLRPGDEILGYRLQALLGKGGMGVTWRAQREYEAEPVALKILPDHLRGHELEMGRVKYIF